MFARNVLLSYEIDDPFVLSDNLIYKLTIERTWFGGLFKTKKEVRYAITPFHDIRTHKEHWDKLIANKTHLPIR